MNSFSHDSRLELLPSTPAELLFPGAFRVTQPSWGYVRSRPRALKSLKHQRGAWSEKDATPFRDYDSQLLTGEEALFLEESDRHLLIVSARNVMNEYGYRARIRGSWFGREGDLPLPADWPILCLEQDAMRFHRYGEAETLTGDLLSGVPLVIDGTAVDRDFLVASCSDVAHSYEVDPHGHLGPSTVCWQELSDAWEEAHQAGLPNLEFRKKLDGIAQQHHAMLTRQNLLHGVVGQTASGNIWIAAISGSLMEIARHLAEVRKLQQAIVLDNGGSTAWLYRLPHSAQTQILVSGPNHRPKGTAFLRFQFSTFLQASSHPVLGPASTDSP